MAEYEDYDLPPGALELLVSTFPCEHGVLKREIFTQVTDVDAYVALMELTIGNFYIKHKGLPWTVDKREEMQTPGLVYVQYMSGEQLAGFISMLLTRDDWGLTIYLYEIHVHPQHMGHSLGSMLMQSLHRYGGKLRESGLRLYNAELAELTSTKLTVFSDNERALAWYFKMGYTQSDESPMDKALRSGKVRRPEYYILYRLL